MKKRSSNVLMILLVICLIASVALNIVLVLKLTDKIDLNLFESEPENVAGIDYDSIKSISLYVNYDEKHDKAEKMVVIRKQENTCNVLVYDSGTLDRGGEFSIDVFNDVVNTMRENNLPVYKPQTNEYGQVIRGTVPYKLTVLTAYGSTDLDTTTIDAMDLIAKIITIGNNIQ